MKLNILFLLYKSKLNSKGKCAIKCRITFKKQRKEFATGCMIAPKSWNAKKQAAIDGSEDQDYISMQLAVIRQNLNQAFLFLKINEAEFNVNDIFLQYAGKPLEKDYGVVEVYNLYLQRIERLIDIEIKQVTYDKYVESGRHLRSFVKFKFHSTDLKFNEIKSSFLAHYEYYLTTEKKLQRSTLNKAIQRLRRVVKYALSEDYLMKDPFIMYRPKSVKKKVLYLSTDQLENLETIQFEIPRIQQIKDMFVFCCYTGLGFSEMNNLKKSDLVQEFDGNLWIHVRRNKTKGFYKVPLLPKAERIVDLYDDEKSDYVLPRMSNTKFNAYLKEIADMAGITFNLTHHIARKTFATTVLLYNDVPIEIVSKLLGHSKIQTTQDSYGEIIQSQISSIMNRFY